MDKQRTTVEEYVSDDENMRLFQQEFAIYEVTGLLEELMEQLGVSRSELASRMGCSKGWITQLLDGESNKSVRTIAGAFAALNHELHFSTKPISIGREAPYELLDGAVFARRLPRWEPNFRVSVPTSPQT